MQLSKQSPVVEKYIAETLYRLPEKVLQFGTGVLLRGLCDYYIDKANKQHVFNGRIVVVKSTDSSGADEFAAQDNLYTHFIRGIEDGVTVDDTVINASISRVLSAKEQWPQILACAANPDMKLIISNTTEIGISYLDEDITTGSAPQSFPGKLLAFLYARYKTFSGSAESGMVVIPTELIVNNADKLKEIVIALASYNRLGEAFVEWVDNANYFCNSLVDRIVPGKLPPAEKRQAEEALAYTDELMLMSEVYSLWAIESAKEKVLQTLSFSTVDKGVVLAPDITRYRELKLRLLNGPHTLCCGLAVLCGFETVKDAMQDETFYKYVHDLMMKEIAPALSNGVVSLEEAKLYAQEVLYRFRNPFLQHKWL
ncbi:MAG TPA: tagaturonate reductase, partial [Chitinophagaceae bacterium]|nr:tagaturonate reductase [Chitinophagaceae bacterium]